MILRVIIAVALFGVTQSTALAQQWGIRSLGDIYSEFGSYTISNDTILARYKGAARLSSAGQHRWLENSGQKFMEQSFAVGSDDLQPGERKAGGFAPLVMCDLQNQVDLSSDNVDIKRSLPIGSKIKSIWEISPTVSAVVFSRSSRKVSYDLWIGIVDREKGKSLSALALGDAGSYCGQTLMENSLWLVLTQEPSASSEYRTLHVYRLLGGAVRNSDAHGSAH